MVHLNILKVCNRFENYYFISLTFPVILIAAVLFTGLLEHVTVLVGIAVGGTAVGGIIHQPYYGHASGAETLGRTLWGIKGIGVGGFTPATPPANQRIIATTRSHSNPLAEQAIAALKADKVMAVGGAGHKVFCSDHLIEYA